jgi:hypothetical protein
MVTVICHHAQLIGSDNFLPGLALNFDHPELCLLSSWDYRHKTLYLAMSHCTQHFNFIWEEIFLRVMRIS